MNEITPYTIYTNILAQGQIPPNRKEAAGLVTWDTVKDHSLSAALGPETGTPLAKASDPMGNADEGNQLSYSS